MTAVSQPDDAPVPVLRKIDCYSLPVDNLDAAIAFYAALGHALLWHDGNHAAGLRLPDSDAEIVLHTDHRPAARPVEQSAGQFGF